MTVNTLYRYKSFTDWDKNRFLSEIDDIKNDRITLVSPELFNDPYDCLIPFFENISEEEFSRILKPHFKENLEREAEKSRGVQGNERILNYEVFDYFIANILGSSSSVKNLAERFEKWFPDFFSKYLDEQGIAFRNSDLNEGGEIWTKVLIGSVLRNLHVFDNFDFSKKINLVQQLARIACFSQTHDSMYFWSHYADSHKGICLEYSFRNDLDLIAKPEEVTYCSSDSNLEFIRKFYSDGFNDGFLFMNKSEDWKQEKEVRIASIKILRQQKEIKNSEDSFSRMRTNLIKENILQKLDGKTDNFDGRRNLEKCECGEFKYRFYSRRPSEKDKVCAQIYCESCDEKKNSKSILKHEYSYQPITKIYLGLRFDENTESAKMLIETAKLHNIPVHKIRTSQKQFALEEDPTEI